MVKLRNTGSCKFSLGLVSGMQEHANIRENQIKAMLIELLLKSDKLLQGHKVFLYGSRAQGNARPRSDFDVGIWGKEPLSLEAFYKLEDMLDKMPTLYKIDLVDLNRTSEKFQEQALKCTEVLYE